MKHPHGAAQGARSGYDVATLLERECCALPPTALRLQWLTVWGALHGGGQIFVSIKKGKNWPPLTTDVRCVPPRDRLSSQTPVLAICFANPG